MRDTPKLSIIQSITRRQTEQVGQTDGAAAGMQRAEATVYVTYGLKTSQSGSYDPRRT